MTPKSKSIYLSVMLFFSALSMQAQVEWEYSSRKVGEDLYEIKFTAAIDEPWKIYSQHTPAGGPRPTSIKFARNPMTHLEGKIKEVGDLKIYHEDVFDVEVYAYAKKAEFVQLVKLRKKGKTNVQVSIEFMACTDEQCLPPATKNFTVLLE